MSMTLNVLFGNFVFILQVPASFDSSVTLPYFVSESVAPTGGGCLTPEATAVFRPSDSALVSHQGAHTYPLRWKFVSWCHSTPLPPFRFSPEAMLLSTGKGVAQ